MGATHDSNINIQVILDAAAPALFGFTPLFVLSIDELPDDDRVRVYTSAKDIDDDSDLTTPQKESLAVAFMQQPRPGEVKVGFRATTTPAEESFAEAMSAIEDADPDWYGFTIDSRADEDIIAASAWAEARTKLFVAQSSDPDWLTTGFPGGFDDIEDNERTALIFHDTDLEAADIAWLTNRLVFNPDTRSAPWDCEIKGVNKYTSAITAGQRSFGIGNNANLMLPYGPSPTFVDPGVLLSGRPIYERVTADWFQIRLESKIAQAKVNASARGEKIPLGQQGISILRPLVESQFSEGEFAGHFMPGQSVVEFISPTQADINAQRIRATAQAQLTVSARLFEFTFNFQRTPIFEDDE